MHCKDAIMRAYVLLWGQNEGNYYVTGNSKTVMKKPYLYADDNF